MWTYLSPARTWQRKGVHVAVKTSRSEPCCLGLALIIAIQLGCGGVTGKSSADPTSATPPTTSSASAGPLTGTWSGTLQMTAGNLGQSSISLTASLQHDITNGQSSVMGAVGFTGSSCLPITTVTIQTASFQDPNFAFDVVTSNGTLHFSGRVNGSNALDVEFQIHGGTCDGASATGTLTRQGSASGPSPGIRFSFKVPQGGTYGGELWVVVPSFVIAGNACGIETRVHTVSSTGIASDISATWTSQNPAIVTVTPRVGHQVNITVSTAGTTGIVVSASGLPNKLLTVQATPQGSALLVCSLTQ
jgi:hypothetical protein